MSARLGVLRPHEREVYDYLDGLRMLEHTQQLGECWWRPMDVGGSDGSHHSRTLAKLVRLGLAERRQRGALCKMRGSWEYRSLETPNVDVTGPRLRGSGGQQGSTSLEDC